MDLHRFSAFDYMKLVVGSALVAAAFQFFTFPNSIVSGGVTGIAQIIRLLTGIPVGVLSILINIPIFYLGWRHRLGTRRLVLALCVMAMISVFIDLLAITELVATDEPMLGAVYGGVLNGAGYGLIYTTGTTGGGTDIVARLLKLKFPWLPMGKLILIPDGVVLALTAIAFQRLETALYGAVALYVSSKVMDTVLYGLNASKVAYIISNHWQKISDAILAYDRGVTILNATGAYSGSEKHVLMVAFRQREIVEIKEIVHEADPAAFLIVCDAHDVLGEGFGEYQKEL